MKLSAFRGAARAAADATESAAKVAAPASDATTATRRMGALDRIWNKVPQQHRPYVVYATLAGVGSLATFARPVDGESKAESIARYASIAAVIGTVPASVLLLATTRQGTAAARLAPVGRVVKWTAPIAVPAAAMSLAQAGAPTKQKTEAAR